MRKQESNICVCGIVAVGPNGVIGRDGKLPWHSKQDMAFFKHTTTNYPCIFGKTTYNNLPIKPLADRLNIVCSSSYKIETKGGVIRVPSLEDAIKQCGNVERFNGVFPKCKCIMIPGRVFVCGGAELYKYALSNDLIDVMYVTEIYDKKLEKDVKENPELYTYFPYNFDDKKWLKVKHFFPYASMFRDTSDIKVNFYRYLKVR